MNSKTNNNFIRYHFRPAALILAATCIFLLYGCGTTNNKTIEMPDQIVLSWTGDPATTQTISWHGETKYDGTVLCIGKSFPAEVTEIQQGSYYRYSAEITGLIAGQTYEYRVGAGTTWSKPYTFTTERNEDFSFMYMGDIQYEIMDRDYKKWGNFIENAYELNPKTAFLLIGGDMVINNNDLAEYEAVLDYGQPLFSSVSVMTTPGNHETAVTPDRYKELFALPENGTDMTKEEVYSFEYGNCHIVSLNSNLFRPERLKAMGQKKWDMMMKQVEEWLVKDLSTSDAKWNVVFMHQPAYPVAENLDIYSLIREYWVPIFEKYEVDVVFVGHQHVYMRTKSINGVTYIMARSGEKYSRYYQIGDPIPKFVKVLEEMNTYEVVSVKSESLAVEAFDANGKEIDQWIKRDPAK